MILQCAANLTAKAASFILAVSSKTAERVFNDFCDYCSKLVDNLEFIEGEPKEIDEFVGSRFKYHRGAPTAGKNKWFFSIIGRESKTFRCFPISARSIE